jgi:D-tyrosyl-tRNA(Tyr) deacylase
MRLVVQRVSSSRVLVEGRVVGEIGRGLLVLVGVTHGDTVEEARHLAGKVVGLRVFEDDQGKMNRGVADVGGAILAVSQFTLYGDCRKGRRPSFDAAARPEAAEALYGEFVRAVAAQGIRVATGVFQSHMQVEIVNDGPVTLLLDAPPKASGPAPALPIDG